MARDAVLQEEQAMSQRVYVRVALDTDGKTPIRELVVDGLKISDLSYIEALELAMQIVSTLRYEQRK